ncbi:hypothetical protein C8J55DRAFT_556590 [Lentinula edodes]|uniref:Uncharacterized protein n=1 Tax=Lentinula lateritia TaxID=40482 RepID=A0A9W9AWU4_9AGAR|nr:hypothetical protein C8J55DRAFT_556590 [Lentinula edodes]
MSLTTEGDINRVEVEIADAVSAGYIHSYIKGMLLGTGIHRPQIVTVPLRPGLRSYRSLDDLLVCVYVARWNRSGMNSNSIGRCHITQFPSNSRCLLSHPSTFFYSEPGTPAPVNTFINSGMVKDQAGFPVLHYGNILVVKHARAESTDPVFDIIDITEGDYVLLKPVLEWYISLYPRTKYTHLGEQARVLPVCGA